MKSLRQYFVDDMRRLDAGQTLVESLELETQFAIVDSHAMQDRRIQIIEVDRVFGDVVAEVVRFAERES